MKKRWLIFGLIISFAFNCAFLGGFGYRLWQKKQGLKSHSNKIRIEKGAKPFEKMILHSEQRECLARLRTEFRPRIDQIRHQLRQERKKLASLLIEDQIDTTVLRKQLEKVGQLQIEIEKEVVHEILCEREVLDPEQREYFLRIVVKRLQGDHHQIPRNPHHIIEKKKKDVIPKRRNKQ